MKKTSSKSNKPLPPAEKGSPMDTFNKALQKIVAAPKKTIKKK